MKFNKSEQPLILVIDDEQSIRDSYAFYLEDLNYRILLAETGKDGIRIFEENKVDLVLLDLRMPEMGGLEVLKVLSRKSPEIPTIVASGTRNIADAVEALNAGAWNYLLKPVEKMSLLRTSIESALNKARLIKEKMDYQSELEEKVYERTRELEKTSNDLHQSKVQLEGILDDIQTGIVIIEKENRTLLYANPSAVRMIGRNIEDILGQACNMIFCPNDTRNCPILDMGESINASERILLRADGQEIPILKTVNETPFNGKMCLLESFIDLTDQKREAKEKELLEFQLRQSQKLESIGTLAGGVAHDFNNLLSGIMGASEILKDLLPGNKETDEYLDMIINTSERAADLTSKLLAFSRRNDLIIDTIDVHDIIKDSLTILEHTLDKKIEIHLALNAEDSSVIADSSALQNIFINLGVNAGHAMPEGGSISIHSENITIQNAASENMDQKIAPGSYIKFSFEDSGTGMPPKVKERIFEPFFTTKEPGHGTGLGLASVYGIIREIHGYIYVYSEVGRGTVFHIYIPLAGEKISTPQAEQHIEQAGEKYTILIIEDDEIIRNMTDTMLRQIGHQVIVSQNGKEAVELYKSKSDGIDIILIDMIMPIMDGQECFKAIRAINPEARILLSSGFANSPGLDRHFQDRFSGFILKPYRLNELQASIRALLK